MSVYCFSETNHKFIWSNNTSEAILPWKSSIPSTMPPSSSSILSFWGTNNCPCHSTSPSKSIWSCNRNIMKMLNSSSLSASISSLPWYIMICPYGWTIPISSNCYWRFFYSRWFTWIRYNSYKIRTRSECNRFFCINISFGITKFNCNIIPLFWETCFNKLSIFS